MPTPHTYSVFPSPGPPAPSTPATLPNDSITGLPVGIQSLLFTDGATNLSLPPGCSPGRSEVPITLRKNGRLYKYILRDRLVAEDPYLVLVKAGAFAIRTGEPYSGVPPSRAVRDFLIKNNVVI